MGQYTSYYLYQKFEQRGEQEAIPVYPNVYSIDADGTRERVVKIQDDPQCGYDPPIKPIYKWVNIPITQDYICDDCPTYQTRWVRTDETICEEIGKVFAILSDGRTIKVDCNEGLSILYSSELTNVDPNAQTLTTNVVIGDCVTECERYLFMNFTNLTSVIIGKSPIRFRKDSFVGLLKLSKVNSNVEGECNIPDNVIEIGERMFANCPSFTSVTIGSGVSRIGRLSFRNCPNINTMTIKATTPPVLFDDFYEEGPWFDGTYPIYVPASSVNAYKTATNWSNYADRIQPIT